MRVNDPNLNPAQLNGTGSTGNTGAAGKTAQLDPIRLGGASSAGKSASTSGDEVQLSSLSSAINQLQPGSSSREAYLESLRVEVASGTYNADPAATAGKMVEEALGQTGLDSASGTPASGTPASGYGQ